MALVTTLAGATALGWRITDTNGNAAAASTATDVWRGEKIFSLSGATTAAYSSYDINTPSASADGSRKVVHEQATLQSQLFAQIDAWETRMQALGDKVLGYPEPSGTATVH